VVTSKDGMGVFGFGRAPKTTGLMRGQQGFVLSLVETSKAESAAKVASALKPLLALVRVTQCTMHGDMECLRITTPSAVYLYGMRGAGFASVYDPSGADWISYQHGKKAAGEYRGMPKCGQPVKYFHCGYGFGQYRTENVFATTHETISPEHVRVHSITRDGAAECMWDFHTDHATMTLLKIPGPYWFLYEGTPGGELNAEQDHVLRPSGERTPLSQPWIEDAPWLLFSAGESPHGLYLLRHQDAAPVSYVSWPYKPDKDGALNQMTVTGFGRPSWDDPKQHTPPLTTLPAKFSIAITAGSDEAAAKAITSQLSRP
jgi:hypothetical protein